MVELEYHPDASDEVAEAFSWHARIAPEVGEQFKLKFEHAEELVQRSPESWAIALLESRAFVSQSSRLFSSTSFVAGESSLWRWLTLSENQATGESGLRSD